MPTNRGSQHGPPKAVDVAVGRKSTGFEHIDRSFWCHFLHLPATQESAHLLRILLRI